MDKYIEMRNSGNFDLVWFFDYYKSKGGKLSDFNEFRSIFSMGDFDSVLDGLDRSFKLNRLYSKDGALLRVFKS